MLGFVWSFDQGFAEGGGAVAEVCSGPVRRHGQSLSSPLWAVQGMGIAIPIMDYLRIPPTNRLERLKGDRTGQYSIRINDQWRICFNWRQGDAFDVEIVDYH